MFMLGAIYSPVVHAFYSPVVHDLGDEALRFTSAIMNGSVFGDQLQDSALVNSNSVFDKDATSSDVIVDCGATKHCVPSANIPGFTITDTNPDHAGMRVGNNVRLPVKSLGTWKFKVRTEIARPQSGGARTPPLSAHRMNAHVSS